MKTAIYCIFLLILSVICNKSLFVNAKAERIVREAKFEKGQYYDVLEYGWNITATQNVGKFEYFVSSKQALCTLIMNSTEFQDWEQTYFKQWLINEEYNFSFLNSDLKSNMCMSPVSTCDQPILNFPYNKMYVVILKRPNYEEPSYIMKDGINTMNSSNSANLIYDPLNPVITIDTTTTATSTSNKASSILSTTESAPPTSSAVSSSTIDDNKQQNNDNKSNKSENKINNGNGTIDNMDDVMDAPESKDKDDDNKSWIWLSIIFGTLFLLLLAASLFTLHKNKKRDIEDLQSDDEIAKNQYINEAGKGVSTKIPYNPLHAVKRVAYDYKSDDVTIERDNILEITKRFNDGWANAINPKDGKECLIPLIILEGDLNEDLSNVPFEGKSSKNILATPKSLYENDYISQKDYEEMKRNDEWMKKVKLMKYGKSESGQDIVDSEQIKYISHPIQETTIEDNQIYNNL